MITGAVLIAANMETKEGRFIPLLEIGSICVVERVVSTFLQAGVDKIVLITGEYAKEVEKKVSHMGVVCLREEDYIGKDMFDLAKIGFSYLEDQCERVAFCPVDIPMFTVDTVRRLLASKEAVISPSYRNKGGHPLVMDASVLSGILSFEGDGGLREALRAAGYEKQWLEVSDEGTMLDIARETISEELVKEHKDQMLHPCLKVSIAKEQIFFGPGTDQLLELIEQTSSVRKACQLMNISYSKGWKMIRLMEEQWGYKIVDRRQGGTTGGSSYLTEEGKDLMIRYRMFLKDIKEQTNQIFHQYFADQK